MRKKRFEIMSQSEIMTAFCPPCVNSGENKCESCIIWKNGLSIGINPSCATRKGMFCYDIVKNFLNETINVQKRYELMTSDEEVAKICKAYDNLSKQEEISLEEYLCGWVVKTQKKNDDNQRLLADLPNNEEKN